MTAQSDFGTLRRVGMRHVRDAFASPAAIDRQWQDLNYLGAPEFEKAISEYDQLIDTLAARGLEIEFMPTVGEIGMDSLYVRDASVATARGMVLCRMGKVARRAEPAAQRAWFESLSLEIAGTIEAPGTLEGGDVAWLDERTVAVGHGYRTNGSGIAQFTQLLGDSVDEVIEVPLPHYRGPSDVFHLMSIVSPLDRNLALVYSPLMPVPFRNQLLERGFELVEVPDEEFDSLGCNSLALAPRTCLLPAGNPQTRARLQRAGVEVVDFSADEICVKGGGGPTCMTRPLDWLL